MKRRKVKRAGHFTAGLLILVHGIISFINKDYETAIGYSGLAILIIIVAALHKYIITHFRRADVAFLFLDGAALFLSGWEFRAEKHFAISYFMIAVGLAYSAWACYALFYEDERGRKRTSIRQSRRHFQSTAYKDYDD